MKKITFLVLFICAIMGNCTQKKPSPEKAKKLSELPAPVREEMDRLASDDAGKRATAIVSLGEMGQEAIPAIQLLIGAVGDRRSVIGPKGRFDVNELAVQTLETLGEPARKALLDALQAEDRDRDQIMWALGKMKETRAVEPIIRILLNDAHLRNWAIEPLVEIGDPRAVEPLIQLLSQDENLRDNIAEALGKLKDPRAVEPLIDALKKDETFWQARDALKEITGQDLNTSDDWARWWEQNKNIKQ
jgi:HEAT repeat protein